MHRTTFPALLAVPLTALLLAASAAPARAAFILTSSPSGPGWTAETRRAGGLYGGITTAVTLGSEDVTIGRFGTFGRMLQAGHLEFVIFEAAGGALIYRSESVSTAAASSDAWYDSPAMTFTLRANTDYRLGVIADSDFTYYWGAAGAAVTDGGLTAVGGVNGNTGRSFADPVNMGDGHVTNSLRVSGPADAEGPVVANPAPPGVVIALSAVPAFGLFLFRRRGAVPVG